METKKLSNVVTKEDRKDGEKFSKKEMKLGNKRMNGKRKAMKRKKKEG